MHSFMRVTWLRRIRIRTKIAHMGENTLTTFFQFSTHVLSSDFLAQPVSQFVCLYRSVNIVAAGFFKVKIAVMSQPHFWQLTLLSNASQTRKCHCHEPESRSQSRLQLQLMCIAGVLNGGAEVKAAVREQSLTSVGRSFQS